MEIKISQKENLLTMSIDGRVDTVTAKDFEVEIQKVLESGANEVVVECEKMSYVSSSGLRGFLILQKGITQKGGKLTLKGLSDPIKEVFKITGFAAIFKIED